MCTFRKSDFHFKFCANWAWCWPCTYVFGEILTKLGSRCLNKPTTWQFLDTPFNSHSWGLTTIHCNSWIIITGYLAPTSSLHLETPSTWWPSHCYFWYYSTGPRYVIKVSLLLCSGSFKRKLSRTDDGEMTLCHIAHVDNIKSTSMSNWKKALLHLQLWT